MKKRISLLLAAVLLLFTFLPAYADVTAAPTPTAPAQLLFTKKLGTGYRNAPTPPAVAGNALLVVAGQFLYKLDAMTGETLNSVQLESASTYTAVPPTVADGKIFMPLDNGVVQAFDLETLAPLWIYTDPLGGQGLCPVTCGDGYLYTGFWNGETNDANYVCLPMDGSGAQGAVWSFTAPGGFYRTAALLYGDYILFGSDNCEREHAAEAPGTVYCLNRRTGAEISSFTLPGDIRAGIGLDPKTGDCYAATKAGVLCRFSADANTGALTKLEEIRLPGGMTVTPEIRNGRLYAACRDGSAGALLVLDAQTLDTIYTASLPGVPQGNLLLSTAYDGETLVYTTCNARPGGVYLLRDAPDRTAGEAEVLFEPAADMAQYCFCPLAVAKDGALYYKNDSGNIFALAGADPAPLALQRFITLVQRLLALFRLVLKGWAAA